MDLFVFFFEICCSSYEVILFFSIQIIWIISTTGRPIPAMCPTKVNQCTDIPPRGFLPKQQPIRIRSARNRYPARPIKIHHQSRSLAVLLPRGMMDVLANKRIGGVFITKNIRKKRLRTSIITIPRSLHNNEGD